MSVVFENLLNCNIKVSYFKYNNDKKTERFIYGTLIKEDDLFVQIRGRTDGKIFNINKEQIIELVGERNEQQ